MTKGVVEPEHAMMHGARQDFLEAHRQRGFDAAHFSRGREEVRTP